MVPFMWIQRKFALYGNFDFFFNQLAFHELFSCDHTAHAPCAVLSCAHACCMLIGACNPVPNPTSVTVP